LREAVGPISRIAILWDLDAEYYRRSWSPAIERAAGQLGLAILGPFQVRNAADFERAFPTMTEQRAEAVLLSPGSVAFPNRARIGELGVRHRLPICLQRVSASRQLDKLRSEHRGHPSAGRYFCW